jgi:hypothetical protein
MPPYVRARLSAYGGEVTIKSKNVSGYSRRTSLQSPNRISHFVSVTLDSLCAESLNASALFQNSKLVADHGTSSKRPARASPRTSSIMWRNRPVSAKSSSISRSPSSVVALANECSELSQFFARKLINCGFDFGEAHVSKLIDCDYGSNACEKIRDGRAPSPAREARALP